VRFFTPQERWFRHARLALMTTLRSPDSQVQLALLPQARRDGLFSVEAQVAFALKDLELIPGLANRTGSWRVGALLNREDGDDTWEMLTLAQATLQGKGGTRLQALHSRTVDDLEPGTYRLRAFVEDAELNRFWSREVTLDLPDAGRNSPVEPWLSSPAMSRWVPRRLELELAPVTKKLPVSSMVGAPTAGFIPMNERDFAAGTILEFRSMLCSGPLGSAVPQTRSFLVQDESAPLRLPIATVGKAGDCVVFIDTMDTFELTPGDYTYRLMVMSGEEEPLLREVALTIFE
jgi:hypothetical protein